MDLFNLVEFWTCSIGSTSEQTYKVEKKKKWKGDHSLNFTDKCIHINCASEVITDVI